jgi:hypothetical protein
MLPELGYPAALQALLDQHAEPIDRLTHYQLLRWCQLVYPSSPLPYMPPKLVRVVWVNRFVRRADQAIDIAPDYPTTR